MGVFGSRLTFDCEPGVYAFAVPTFIIGVFVRIGSGNFCSSPVGVLGCESVTEGGECSGTSMISTLRSMRACFRSGAIEVASESVPVPVVSSVSVEAGCEPVETVLRKLSGVDLLKSSGNAPGMLDISESEKRASLRRLVCDLDAFAGSAFRDAASTLFLPSSISAFASSAVFLMLPPLPDLLTFGFSAVKGGEGGARCGADLVPFAGVEFLLADFSFPTSVASGVNGEEGLLISSLLPTASLLCTLLNAGYDACGRASPLGLRSISGTSEAFLVPLSLVAERGESISRSRSLLFDLRLRTFKLVLELAFSRLR